MSKEAFAGVPKRALFLFAPEEIIIVGLDTSDGPEHHQWDERIKLPVKESLVLSIMASGVHDAVTVCKDGEGLPVAVSGRQRIRAAREANKRLAARGEPPIRVRAQYDSDDETNLMAKMVETNEHRQDDGILTRAAKAKRLEARGLTVTEIAVKFGKDPQTIRNWIRLNALDPHLKEAVRDGACTATDAVALADKSQAEQKRAGLAYLEAAEDGTPRPKRESKARAPGTHRKRRSEKVLRRSLAKEDATPEFRAAVSWYLDPGVKRSALKGMDLDAVLDAIAWIHGEEMPGAADEKDQTIPWEAEA